MMLIMMMITDANLVKKCGDIFKEQLEKGIIGKVDYNEDAKLIHYLPHHPVVTPHKNSTKVRIVFDASSKAKKGLNSLNDFLYRGPLLLPVLCGILLRFRLMNIAIVADIDIAFLQIQLKESERDVTRFLWLKLISKFTL